LAKTVVILPYISFLTEYLMVFSLEYLIHTTDKPYFMSCTY